MDIGNTKLEIMRPLLNTDNERILKKVEDVQMAAEKDEVAGYTVNSRRLTKENFIKRALKSAEDFKAGRITHIEQVVEQIND